MATDFVMTVSRNGQVSIPAQVRARWRADIDVLTDKVVVVDMGDHLVVAPALADPVGALAGRYADRRGPTTDQMRRQERRADAEQEAARSRPAGKRPRSA